MSSSTSIYKPFTVAQIPDLKGKVALVTGANSPNGIGFNTAFHLAAKGATVYIGARSAAKCQEAIIQMQKLDASITPSQLRPFVTDLGDLKAVQTTAKKMMETTDRLDILINNAGLLAKPLDLDSQGVSVSFNTNHLGPFVLTTTLLPLLKKNASQSGGDVRVITVSSSTHALPPSGIRFNTPESFNIPLDGMTEHLAQLGIKGTAEMASNLVRYGLSKLANLLFAKQLQNIFDAEGINAISISLHPGGVKTDGSIKFVGEDNLSRLDASLSPLEGALTSLFAATSPKVLAEKKTYGGAYLVPFGKIETPSENGRNAQLAEELWRTSESVVNRVLQS